MKSPSRKKYKIIIGVLLGIYLLGGILLYAFQEKILFHPRPLPADHKFSFEQPFTEINIPVSNSKILNGLQFTVPDSIEKGVVLYFHGNRRNVERYARYATDFTQYGYELWMLDYPGFGKSTGERTESVFYADAMEIYKLARTKFEKNEIIIYGKSLGTGIATQLASVRDCQQLILETPYTNIPSLARSYAFMYPLDWMSKFYFPTEQYIVDVTAPITVFHGTEDEVIPISEAEKLKKIKPSVDLVIFEGGRHNNLPRYDGFKEKMKSLLK